LSSCCTSFPSLLSQELFIFVPLQFTLKVQQQPPLAYEEAGTYDAPALGRVMEVVDSEGKHEIKPDTHLVVKEKDNSKTNPATAVAERW